MDKFLKYLYFMFGSIYIPQELKSSVAKIVHISDTPYQVFEPVISFVRKLNPQILVHTGDIVDDIKLELIPHKAEIYKKRAEYFLNMLSLHVTDKIIIIPGNHDKVDILNLKSNISVYSEGSIIDIQGIKAGTAHKFEHLPDGCEYYFYGHDKTLPKDTKFLNGIYGINIINDDMPRVHSLPYPAGTDDYRLKRNKIGI